MIPALAPHRSALRGAAWTEPLGIYVHIPFCVDRCTYCSFVTTRDNTLKPAVLDRLEQDIRTWGEDLDHPPVDTLYLGGGTPSVLEEADLERLTQALRESFDLGSLREATLEANPGTLDEDWLSTARGLGWDRISLGAQSLDDDLLARLGRIHSSVQVLDALEEATHAGFKRISADLMVGIPGQRLEGVLEDAQRLVETGAEHLSIYMLDLDKNCPLKAQVDAGRLQLPSENEVAEVYEALQESLPRVGLQPYEISNYAVPGQESVHNTRYWERRPYLGLGPSAASQLGIWRWTEGHVISAWAEAISEAEIQALSPLEALAEIPLLALRLHRGVDWAGVRQLAAQMDLLPFVESWEAQMNPFLREGLLLREGGWLRFSPRGMLLSNALFQLFV